jgi:ribosomal-protein-alanine N-acetyltransferase
VSAPRIRPGRSEDLDALLALEALFPSDRMSRRAWRRFLASPRAEVLVAETGAKLLGDLLLLHRADSRKARIYSLVVAPAARGMGLGEALVMAAERAAAARGARAVSLEVRLDNLAARGLYEKHGYRQIQVLPGYYTDGADGLRLLKPLPADLVP